VRWQHRVKWRSTDIGKVRSAGRRLLSTALVGGWC
jgi:hypothetical protein